MDSEISKENETAKYKVDEMFRKWELEQKLLEKELDWYEKIEDKRGKDNTDEAFENLSKKYDKFKKCLVESIGKP